jgi:hypothetical protein
MNALKKYLIIAEQIIELHALVEAETEDEAAVLAEENYREVGSHMPEILEIVEVKEK